MAGEFRPFLLAVLVFGLVLCPAALPAQEAIEGEILGFEEDFAFDEQTFDISHQKTKEEAEKLSEAAQKPGSVESMAYLAEQVEQLQKPGKLAPVMRVALSLTLLTLLPAILLTMTSFTRIVIVFSFVRRAMTLQTLPPNQIIIGLSLFLTWFIMGPTIDKLNQKSLQPMLREEISEMEALGQARDIMHEFMLRYTREKDIALFVELSRMERPERPQDVPMQVLLPAFVISELKTAFQMGFVIFLPFLVIDIVVATVLVSMGMFMLPPPMVSIPFKILLFVLVDGWSLIVRSLALSFA
jgi:flagellar biosynthetic protein FliP